MTYFHLFPQIQARTTIKPKKKERGRWDNGRAKYDHWQMLQDRVSGMSWTDVAIKHGIQDSASEHASNIAKRLALNSRAAKKLSPTEVEAIAKNEEWNKE